MVNSTDAAGNRTEKTVTGITVDTRQTSVFLTADKTGFSPNGDGFLDDVRFNTYVNLQDGIASWSLSLIHESGATEKVFKGTGKPAPLVVWDGRGDKGVVREGTYTASFVVVYEKGDEPEARVDTILLDISPPDAKVRLSPVPFSPDNDGVEDELVIALSVSDASAVRDWSFQIFDPTGVPFNGFSGKGNPTERIIWNGLSNTGELVQAAEDYPYKLFISDSLGNAKTYEGLIPVDVLVIREGDRLKIRISSITFPAYRADIVYENKEASEKNLRILKRLAEILNKYSTYQVQIEGHAVREYWNFPNRIEREEREELQPLSLKRAESVKTKLIELGVAGRRLTTTGLGGTQPVVPHSDLQNRWKNRRVEFILLK